MVTLDGTVLVYVEIVLILAYYFTWETQVSFYKDSTSD